MASVRRVLGAVGLVALLFAPGAAGADDLADHVEAASLAPTFSSGELAPAARTPSTPVAASAVTIPVAMTTALGVALLAVVLAVGLDLPRRAVVAPAPVGRRGPPPVRH